jgi:hypothetical protein
MGFELTNLPKSSKSNVAAGGGMDNEIILIKADDVSSFPDRATEDDTVISENITMKTGKYMHKIYFTPGTIEPTFKKIEGDNQDIIAWETGIKGFHPGLEKSLLKFLNQHAATEFYLILRNTSASLVYLLGEPGNPLSMKEGEALWGAKAESGKGYNMTLSNSQSKGPAIYEGELTFDESSSSASASASTSASASASASA